MTKALRFCSRKGLLLTLSLMVAGTSLSAQALRLYGFNDETHIDGMAWDDISYIRFVQDRIVLEGKDGENVEMSIVAARNLTLTATDYTPIADHMEEVARVYPNPANQELYIEGTREITSVQVLSLSGQVMQAHVSTSSTSVNQVRVDVQDLASGIYIIRYVVNGQTRIQKFVKQ